MNKIVNKRFLSGDQFIHKMHLKHPGLTYSTCGALTKTKGELKNLWKQKTQIIFTRMILIKLVFNMIRLMENTKICLKKQNQIEFLTLQIIQNMMDIKEN